LPLQGHKNWQPLKNKGIAKNWKFQTGSWMVQLIFVNCKLISAGWVLAAAGFEMLLNDL
jgi:hypothetical protein